MDGYIASASTETIVALFVVMLSFSSFSLRSEAWTMFRCLCYTLCFLKRLLIPKYPTFGKPVVKLVAGTTSLVGKLPSGFCFLWSLTNIFGWGIALELTFSFRNSLSFVETLWSSSVMNVKQLPTISFNLVRLIWTALLSKWILICFTYSWDDMSVNEFVLSVGIRDHNKVGVA